MYVLLENGMYVIIVLYVDALIVIGDNNINIHKTWEWLSSKFEMMDLRLLHYRLSIEV